MGHLRALSKTNFEELDDMLEGYFELNPSFASREQLLQNERMQEEAVLNWLERDTYAALHREVLQKIFPLSPFPAGLIMYPIFRMTPGWLCWVKCTSRIG